MLRSASIVLGNNTLTIRTAVAPFFSLRHCQHLHPHARRIFASSFSTGPPGDRGALHCHWNAIATQPIGLVPVQERGILLAPSHDDGDHARPRRGLPPATLHRSSPGARFAQTKHHTCALFLLVFNKYKAQCRCLQPRHSERVNGKHRAQRAGTLDTVA